jgi:hypothetical protein
MHTLIARPPARFDDDVPGGFAEPPDGIGVLIALFDVPAKRRRVEQEHLQAIGRQYLANIRQSLGIPGNVERQILIFVDHIGREIRQARRPSARH